MTRAREWIADTVATLLVLVVLAPRVARADDERATSIDDDGGAHHVEVPPSPRSLPPDVLFEVHGGATVPILKSNSCPTEDECVLGEGIGVGFMIERRAMDRLGLLFGYDFSVLDADSLFEVSALHAVRFGLRYVFDDASLVHPFADAMIGFLAFGDTGAATVGGMASIAVGAEVELTESIAVHAAIDTWAFALAPFTTRDGMERSGHFGVDLALLFRAGIAVSLGPVF